VLVATALVGKYFASAGALQNAKHGRPAAAVNVVPVELADVPVTVSAIGTVTPIDSATVHAQLSGNVFSVLFREGQMVKEGQVIVQIDPRPYQLALASAKASLAKDEATLGTARLDLARYQKLAAQDSVARQTLDTQIATVKQDEAAVAADRAAIGTAQLNLAYTAVKSPFAGRIGLKQVSVGTYATASDTNGVAVVTRTDPIDVEFSVPQAQLAAIRARAGSPAGLPVTVLDQDNRTSLAQGQFSTFDNQIDTTTGTVKAKARIPNPSGPGHDGGVLFPNQFVNVSMLVDTLHQVPVVPTSAVRHGSPGDFVFVVQPDKTVKLVVVKTGPSDGVKIALLEGVAKGQVVVSEGADGLADGSAVRLPGSSKNGSGQQKQHQAAQ